MGAAAMMQNAMSYSGLSSTVAVAPTVQNMIVHWGDATTAPPPLLRGGIWLITGTKPNIRGLKHHAMMVPKYTVTQKWATSMTAKSIIVLSEATTWHPVRANSKEAVASISVTVGGTDVLATTVDAPNIPRQNIAEFFDFRGVVAPQYSAPPGSAVWVTVKNTEYPRLNVGGLDNNTATDQETGVLVGYLSVFATAGDPEIMVHFGPMKSHGKDPKADMQARKLTTLTAALAPFIVPVQAAFQDIADAIGTVTVTNPAASNPLLSSGLTGNLVASTNYTTAAQIQPVLACVNAAINSTAVPPETKTAYLQGAKVVFDTALWALSDKPFIGIKAPNDDDIKNPLTTMLATYTTDAKNVANYTDIVSKLGSLTYTDAGANKVVDDALAALKQTLGEYKAKTTDGRAKLGTLRAAVPKKYKDTNDIELQKNAQTLADLNSATVAVDALNTLTAAQENAVGLFKARLVSFVTQNNLDINTVCAKILTDIATICTQQRADYDALDGTAADTPAVNAIVNPIQSRADALQAAAASLASAAATATANWTASIKQIQNIVKRFVAQIVTESSRDTAATKSTIDALELPNGSSKFPFNDVPGKIITFVTDNIVSIPNQDASNLVDMLVTLAGFMDITLPVTGEWQLAFAGYMKTITDGVKNLAVQYITTNPYTIAMNKAGNTLISYIQQADVIMTQLAGNEYDKNVAADPQTARNNASSNTGYALSDYKDMVTFFANTLKDTRVDDKPAAATYLTSLLTSVDQFGTGAAAFEAALEAARSSSGATTDFAGPKANRTTMIAEARAGVAKAIAAVAGSAAASFTDVGAPPPKRRRNGKAPATGRRK